MANDLETLMAEANADNTDAQFKLGVCYLHGIFVEKDLDDAIKWFVRAEVNGHPEAAEKKQEAEGILDNLENKIASMRQLYRKIAGQVKARDKVSVAYNMLIGYLVSFAKDQPTPYSSTLFTSHWSLDKIINDYGSERKDSTTKQRSYKDLILELNYQEENLVEISELLSSREPHINSQQKLVKRLTKKYLTPEERQVEELKVFQKNIEREASLCKPYIISTGIAYLENSANKQENLKSEATASTRKAQPN